MRVLHVLHTSHPNISGYSVRSKNIVEHQSTIEIEPMVVTSPRGPDDGPEACYGGIRYCRTKMSRFHNAIGRLPFLREVAEMRVLKKKLSEILTDNPIDLIHVHSPVLYGLPALKIARKFSIPMVYEIRAFFEDSAVDRGISREGSMRYRLTRYLETNLAQKCDAVIGICTGICNELISRGIDKQKVHLVPNGVDTKRFVPMEKEPELVERYGLSDCTVLGFIGSFFEFEGLACLVKAMHEISKHRRDVKLLIVGSGDEESNIKGLTKELGLTDSVIFTGRVPHDEILRYYSVIDILVYPRIRTRQTELVTPLKPLEAMSMKKAVICSDVGGLTELASDSSTGVVFQAGSVDDLVRKILSLINNKEYREGIGIAAQQEVLKNRGWAKIILRYEEIYERVIAGDKQC